MNEGFTSVDAVASFGAKLRFAATAGMNLQPESGGDPEPRGSLDCEFSITGADGLGLGPQSLPVACQFPRVGFGIALAQAYAGSYVDVVAASNTTLADAMAPVPCQRGQVVITGSAGVAGRFLGVGKSSRTQIYRKELVRTLPDVKACQLDSAG